MLKSTGVQAGKCFNLQIPHKITFIQIELLDEWSSAEIVCFSISPCVSLSVVDLEPDQFQLTLKQPQVRAGLSFAHQVLMCPL